MAGRGNLFSRDYSTSNSSESSDFHNPIPEEGGREHLYSVDNEVASFLSTLRSVEAQKFAGNNSKGFSPVNVPNYPVTVWCGESIRFAVQLP